MSNCFTCQNQCELSNPLGQCFKEKTMSKRAEIAALKAFPPKFTSPKRYAKRVQSEKVDTHATIRRFYQEVYEQAEKDLALTWEDMKQIHHIAEHLKEYLDTDIIVPFGANQEAFYTEVLRRFNEMKQS